METEKTVGYLETVNTDGQVEKSSKRLVGVVSFAIGGLLLTALAVVSFFSPAADPDTILTVGSSFLIAGSSLLGIGVLEGIGGKK